MDSLDKKLQGFQLIAQEKLQAIIASIPGKKDLILEQSVIKPLEHICSASWLKLKGIQRIYKFDSENALPRAKEIQVFMIRSHLETFQRVLTHIQEHICRQPSSELDIGIRNFHIICIPSCYSYLQCLLEEEGLYGLVQLHRYNWDFIHLDQGVLSMDMANVFSTIFMHNDTSPLPAIAQSLRILQMMCGRPDLILTYGEHSANIIKMLNTLDRGGNESLRDGSSDFSTMIIVDRDRDYVSGLLSPTIYAGLLLEIFNMRAGEVNIAQESNKISNQKLQIFTTPKTFEKKDQKIDSTVEKVPAKQTQFIRLNSLGDEIYGENRYKHFVEASSLVRSQAKALGLEVHKLSDMKLDEMHDYVARKLPKITELKTKVMNHLVAIEKIIEMLAGNFRKVQSLEEDILNNVSHKQSLSQIDELLTTDGQKFNTLRLMCLLHLCAGVAMDEMTQFMRNYCNYFGAQHLHAFQQLANANLLPTITEEDKLYKSTKLLSNLNLSIQIPKFQQTEFQANSNRLKLLVTSAGAESTATPNTGRSNSSVVGASCPSYVFNNLYIPLVAQLAAFLLKSTTSDDFASKLGMIDKMEVHLPSSAVSSPLGIKSMNNHIKQGEVKDIFPLRTRNIFVYIVGGATYAEIGACDLIGRLHGARVVVASDSIISGADLISAAF